MGIASSLRKVATKGLSKLGGNITIRQITNGSYNTTTGAVSESNSDTVVKAVIENVNNSEVNDQIQAQDKKITISAGDIPSNLPPNIIACFCISIAISATFSSNSCIVILLFKFSNF